MPTLQQFGGPTSGGGGSGFTLGPTSQDIRAYGAGTAATDNAPPVQGAHDAILQPNTTLAGGTNLNPGVIFIPAGQWNTRSPIWLDGDNVIFDGEGAGVSIIKCLSACPPLIVGVKRRTKWNATARDTTTLTGTATFTNGSATVTGSSTLFRDQLLPGSQIKLNADNVVCTVASVQSDTSLTLTANYTGTGGTGSSTRDMAYLASMPAIFAADHRVDCYGKLDTSLASSPGQRYGITSKSPSSGSPYPDHFVSVSAFPPQTGLNDGWSTVTRLTLDFCIEGPAPVGGGTAGPPQGKAIMGMGSELQPDPWQLDQFINGGVGYRQFRFTFYTATGYQSFNNPRTFYFGDIDALSGVNRITLQIDFTKNQDGTTGSSALCAIHAWINGAEQSVTRGYGCRNTTPQSTEPSFTAADGWTFGLNEVGPFQIWNNDVIQNDWRPTGDIGYRGAFNIYGLWVGTTADYVTSGGNQVRADSGTLNDAYRYTGASGRSTSGLVAYLYLNDPPTADYPGKLVRFQTGSTTGSLLASAGLYCRSQSEDLAPAVSNITIRDVTVQAAVSTAAKAIAVGQCLNLTFEDVTAQGGWQGIGALNVGAVFFVRFLGYNQLSGTDCGLYGNAWVLRAENVNVNFAGYAGVRLVQCDARIGSVVSAGYTSRSQCLVKIKSGGYASRYEIGETYVDQENAPAHPAVICERHQSVQVTDLTIRRLGAGYQDGTTPQVQLLDFWPSNASNPAIARLTLSGVAEARGLIVQTVGQWEGTIEGIPTLFSNKTQPVQSVDASPASKVISIHYLDDVPNNLSNATGSVWLAGAHRIHRRNPPSGQWSLALCNGSGTVGGSAPTWVEFNNLP